MHLPEAYFCNVTKQFTIVEAHKIVKAFIIVPKELNGRDVPDFGKLIRGK